MTAVWLLSLGYDTSAEQAVTVFTSDKVALMRAYFLMPFLEFHLLVVARESCFVSHGRIYRDRGKLTDELQCAQ